ncbi:acetylornithine transaminase [Acaryochloris sp. IP29b_bin.137]|uniref:acetylornithine transaminase n=1 Tax=Acaryochloris sp. IP29b_bin.137 TaxID=2969217 RepID=UPI0026198C7D|nr:acetylornithine transaminase [Acaryochloris sp. IP29b_bin.137]
MSPTEIAQDPSAVSTQSFSAAHFDQDVMITYGRFPIALERGQGCRVWDTDGREYLDFVAGIATCTLGHAHPALVAAVTAQIQTLHHVSNLYYIPPQGDLAHWLTQHSCADRAFFCNSGAEANEGAIKLARKYAHTVLNIEQPIILTADASFHGRTLATITATAQPKYQKNFDPLVPGFEYGPFNDLAALKDKIATLDRDQRRVAAILLEPLQGEGGVRPGQLEYFQGVRQICDDTGILLILDEVQVGIGRTGHLWGYQNLGIEPDVFTLAKGLAGGIPIGAMLSKEFCSVFQPGDHASTFGGNPLACAAALAVLDTLEAENLLENAAQRGEQLRTGLRKIKSQYSNLIAEVRGWGLINGLVLKDEIELTSIEVIKAAMEAGLLLVPAGPKVVRFVPPLVVSEAAVDKALQTIQQVLPELGSRTCCD